MKLLGKIIGFVIAAPIVFLIGGFIIATVYSNWFTYTHRWRMTIEVETPQGLKTGSSVLKSVYVQSPSWVPQSSSLSSGLHGEAVFVDLGEGKNVVALLALGANGDQYFGPDIAAEALGRDRNEGTRFWWKAAPGWTGSAELTGKLMPTLVTFADPLKPETARVISPDEFETVLGTGYRFKRVWIEMTRENVTRNLSNKIAWLNISEAHEGFWKALYASGFRPNGSTEAQTLLTR